MCDLAELLILEQLERQVLADRQGLLARGVTKDLPFFPEERTNLLARLAAEPEAPGKGLSTEEYELRRALRVA